MNKISNYVWGLFLIIIGLILGLNIMGITNISIFFDGWWTLFIIIPCLVNLFKEEDKTGSIIGLLIGISLFLACQDILDFSIIWKLLLPIILIVFGISIIFKDIMNGKVKEEIKKLNKGNDKKEYYATFSYQNLDFSFENFEGCDLNAIFGGIKCDLRNANIKKDIVINATAIFGGIDILVSDLVNVKVNSTSIFGSVDNKRKNSDDNKVTIYINTLSLFGGVLIK